MIEIQTTRKRLNKGKIIILIDGWNYNKFGYYLIKKIIPSEYGYIQYSYSSEILNSNPLNTKKYFLELINKIEKDVNDLLSIKPRSVYMYGQSLGGLFCMILADKIDIKNEMLVVPGCNLADSFWHGKYTKRLKDEMINKHDVKLQELKECWEEISPDSYFNDKGCNTDYYIILAKNDEVIPTHNGKRLLELLNQRNVKYKLSWSRLSHKMTLIKELFFLKNFKKWISNLN